MHFGMQLEKMVDLEHNKKGKKERERSYVQGGGVREEGKSLPGVCVRACVCV